MERNSWVKTSVVATGYSAFIGNRLVIIEFQSLFHLVKENGLDFRSR
jgi:3-hydroxyacyl-CoA dehydrogenase